MGEMADLHEGLMDEEMATTLDYFNNGAKWFVEETASSRKPIVLSIRRQWKERGQISPKQQWALAYSLVEMDTTPE